jgi:hypothetical protein
VLALILNYKPPHFQTEVTVASVMVGARTRHHTQHVSLTYTLLWLATSPDLETSLAGFDKLGPSVDPSNAHLRGFPLEQARSNVP